MEKCRWSLSVVLLLALVAPCSAGAAGQEDEDYWKNIRRRILAYNKAGGLADVERTEDALHEYLQSLGPRALILAGRQATSEATGVSLDADDPEYIRSMVWFWEYYPKNTNGLSEIQPLLVEIQDARTQHEWRHYLEYLLTEEWEEEGRLTNDQRLKISDALLSVLEREDEHPAVVAGAAEGVPKSLAALKEDLPPAEEAKKRREALRALTGLSERYLKTAAVLVSEPEGDAAVLRATLGGLVRVAELGVAETGAARAALRKAARNFASYPEELWPRLMLTAVKLRAEADFEKLLAEASDAAEQEQVAERLGAVRSLLDKTQVAAARKEDKEGDTKAPAVRRLSDCSPAELLVMARHRADLLAQGRVGEGAWSELSAILREYESRPEPK